MHQSIYELFNEHTNSEDFMNKRILEVGSKYVNGSIRPLIENFSKPKEYIGIDVENGKFVDLVLSADRIVEYFGTDSFDVIISTELLEHVVDWRTVITNMKLALREDGLLIITTRSYGFPYHSYPFDTWRYELEDFKEIFSDMDIIVLKRDHGAPGVFFKARKPKGFKANDLSDIALYSMLVGKRTKEIPDPRNIGLRRLLFRLYSIKPISILMGLYSQYKYKKRINNTS